MQDIKTNETFDSLDKSKLERMLDIKEAHREGHLTLEEAKERMKKEVGSISPEEFAAAEQLFKERDQDECQNEDVRTMLQLFEGLINPIRPDLPFGHPIDAYLRENDKAKELLDQADALLERTFIPNPWIELMETLMGYKLHFARKQNQLYSTLEQKGFDRPSTTMWTYDDHIRDEMNKAMSLLREKDYDSFPAAYKEMAIVLRDLMEKEELILYPTSLKLISDKEFETMKHGDREIGFFLIDMPELDAPAKQSKEAHGQSFMAELGALLAKHGMGTGGQDDKAILDVAEGKLTLEQINLLFRHLPVDISFVDENELVCFYTDTKHRVFPRSKGVIGREVRNCHPPKSVHIVEEIIDKFRRGEQDRAEFWINKPGVFIYIVYVAIRDADGRFRGVMEMMQDCTRIRSLEGSRTLLTWDEEQSPAQGSKESESDTVGEDGIRPDTKLKSLLQRYPRLMDDLPTISSKFTLLRSPMAKVILPVATIKMMSERADIPSDMLIGKLESLIASYNKPDRSEEK